MQLLQAGQHHHELLAGHRAVRLHVPEVPLGARRALSGAERPLLPGSQYAGGARPPQTLVHMLVCQARGAGSLAQKETQVALPDLRDKRFLKRGTKHQLQTENR